MRIPHSSWFRIGLPVLVCLTLLSLGIVVGRAQRRVRHVTWQQSVEPQVQLGIRDKLGVLGKYTAVFVVTAPDGERQRATRQVVDSDVENDWGEVSYPGDFGALLYQSGTYRWECRVDGEVVAKGTFEYKSMSTGQRLTIPDS